MDWSSYGCSSDLRFRQQARAATDIERALAGEWHLLRNVRQPHRIERMQGALWAVRVPPAAGQCAEMRQFRRTGVIWRCTHFTDLDRLLSLRAIHGALPRPGHPWPCARRSEEHPSELQSLMR